MCPRVGSPAPAEADHTTGLLGERFTGTAEASDRASAVFQVRNQTLLWHLENPSCLTGERDNVFESEQHE